MFSFIYQEPAPGSKLLEPEPPHNRTAPKHWFPALLWRIIGGFFTFCIRILILSMRLRIQEVSHNADPDAHSVPLSVFNWHVGLNTVVLSPHRLFSCTRDYKHLVYLIITNNMIV